MIYSSLLFIYGFLPLSLFFYYITPKKFRDESLLALSLVFCGLAGLSYLAFISVFTLVNYGAVRAIGHYRGKSEAAAGFLAAGLLFDILTVFLFRAEMFSVLLGIMGIPESFFPIGISFMTLAAIGTLMDVYNGKTEADRNIVRFALYFTLFPRIIMGPLLRYGSFVKILGSRKPDLSDIGVGLTIFVKGLAKKVIAADTLYMLFEAVRMNGIRNMSSLSAWLGVIAYVMCLYFTLSGFADMGTGAGYCFGLRLPQSFNYPLFSMKIRYFAARWHVQLIQWMRRYVTKPFVSRSRNRIIRKLIFICVWGILGFWYTFSINGLIWGILIGGSIVVETRLGKQKMLNVTGVIYTFLAVMVFTVFFFGDSLSYSLRYLLIMIGGGRNFADAFSLYLLKSYIVVLLITMYASTDLFRNMIMRSGRSALKTAVTVITPVTVLGLLIVCTALISYGGTSEMLLIRL